MTGARSLGAESWPASSGTLADPLAACLRHVRTGDGRGLLLADGRDATTARRPAGTGRAMTTHARCAAHRRRVRRSSVLRRRLRPARLPSRRQAGLDRRRSRRRRFPTAISARKAPRSYELLTHAARADDRSSTARRSRRDWQDARRSTPRSTWSPTASGRRASAASTPNARRPAADAVREHRAPRRRDARQRRELPDQEALRRRPRDGRDQQPGPDMT